MATRDLPSRIARRATRAGAPVSPAVARQLASYLELLARWNRKINLTGLHVDPPDDEAIDRLVIEPVAAAKHVASNDRVVLDVGSGGGSPALPLKLALPRLSFVLVESKVRKAAFLRQAVRELGLSEARVENRRLEDLDPLVEPADLATVRAVRIDDAVLAAIEQFLRPAGRVFVFGAQGGLGPKVPGFVESAILVPELRSQLFVFRKPS